MARGCSGPQRLRSATACLKRSSIFFAPPAEGRPLSRQATGSFCTTPRRSTHGSRRANGKAPPRTSRARPTPAGPAVVRARVPSLTDPTRLAAVNLYATLGSYVRVAESLGVSRETARRWLHAAEIGRASCRDRVCQYVSVSVVAVSVKKKNKRIKRVKTNY